MDLADKWLLFVLLAIGKRDEALKRIRDTYRVNDEEANKLLQAIEAESPLPNIDRSKLLRWTGKGVFVLGLIVTAVGLVRLFAFAPNDEKPFDVVNCTVKHLEDFPDGSREVIITYEFKGVAYADSARDEVFRRVDIRKGQVLELWVNSNDPKEILLPILRPYIEAWGLRTTGIGIVLIVISIILWRVLKSQGA